jgi:hypothetical protein
MHIFYFTRERQIQAQIIYDHRKCGSISAKNHNLKDSPVDISYKIRFAQEIQMC